MGKVPIKCRKCQLACVNGCEAEQRTKRPDQSHEGACHDFLVIFDLLNCCTAVHVPTALDLQVYRTGRSIGLLYMYR